MKIKFLLVVLVVLMSCKNKTPKLPVLSFNYIDGKKELYKIDNFIFTNQDGETVTSSSTEGKVHTMNFFFTSCPSICPPMRIKQQDLAETFSEEKNFKQYSISIDFKNDTVDKLKKHAELHNINSTQWNLLRAPSEEKLEDIASVLKTNFKPNEDGTDFYHSSYVALIDKEQYIRGFYNILLDEEVTLLKRDIESLLD
ncbi:SCO family protein [Psychroserpens luteus]|uniref:SCO family protein n=1 Tax=Psychroserpens luteus TaxID=1434066 RepID=A0ABW5ZWY7_9FLAO|nr:SCO family protein [Psychroserpens luteus]